MYPLVPRRRCILSSVLILRHRILLACPSLSFLKKSVRSVSTICRKLGCCFKISSKPDKTLSVPLPESDNLSLSPSIRGSTFVIKKSSQTAVSSFSVFGLKQYTDTNSSFNALNASSKGVPFNTLFTSSRNETD